MNVITQILTIEPFPLTRPGNACLGHCVAVGMIPRTGHATGVFWIDQPLIYADFQDGTSYRRYELPPGHPELIEALQLDLAESLAMIAAPDMPRC